MRNRSKFKKAYMKILAMPINVVAALLSLLLLPLVRGYKKARELDVKLESKEKGN